MIGETYTASVCCNIAVYIITLIILKNGNQPNNIGPADFYKFKEISLIIIFIGIMSSLIFYCGTWKKAEGFKYEAIPEDTIDLEDPPTNETSRNFLRSPTIYLVSLMYMASRLFTTLNLIYIPLYLDERESNVVIKSDGIRQTIASVPLVSFMSSFLTSIILKYRMKCCNDKVAYLIGSFVSLVGCIWIGMGISPYSNKEIYVIASILGVGGSSTMIASLCLTAEFANSNGYGGGSVYSMVTFTDKLISGAVVLIVQRLQCTPRSLCPQYYEHVLVYICGTVSIIGLVSLTALQCHTKLRNSNIIVL